MPAVERRVEKYSSSGLLVSSAGRAWSGLAAELRSHSEGVIAKHTPQVTTEIVIDPSGDIGTVVTRQCDGTFEKTMSRRGMVWLCPVGVQEDLIELSDRLPGMLHLWLEPDQFSANGLGESFDGMEYSGLRFEGGFEDPLIAHIGYAILAELHNETPAGRLLVETLACSLAARLIQKHANTASSRTTSLQRNPDVGRQRLRRVKDYVEANLHADISLDDLASTACLSRFHFARSFKDATGMTPQQYVNERRMVLAQSLLSQGNTSLNDIALMLNFSSQATFTRAFRKSVGHPPGRFALLNTQT
jgi:AraC family transcriptional regulator